MKRNILRVLTIVLFLVLGGSVVLAHVPYFEHKDFTEENPFMVRKSIEQSIAVYSFLAFDSGDVDVYQFTIENRARIFVETIVPVCEFYEDFLPSFAIVGPGLPLPDGFYILPFDIPDEYGAIVISNFEDEGERPTFYEFFGNKNYYQGPTFDEFVEMPGTYYIYVWDPENIGGDYVLIIGDEEIWELNDIVRGFIYTPQIREGKELHTDECGN